MSRESLIDCIDVSVALFDIGHSFCYFVVQVYCDMRKLQKEQPSPPNFNLLHLHSTILLQYVRTSFRIESFFMLKENGRKLINMKFSYDPKLTNCASAPVTLQ